MDYIPPDEPLPDAESLLGDSEDETNNGGGGESGGCVVADDGPVKYSRLRLILQAPETVNA